MKKNSQFLVMSMAVAATFCQLSFAQQAASNLTIGLANCCKEGDVFQDNCVANVQKMAKEAGVKIIFDSAIESETDDRTLQFNQVKKMIDGGAKAIVISLAKGGSSFHKEILSYARGKNVPVVAYTRAPSKILQKDFDNLYFVGSIPDQAGILQAEMIAELWKAHPEWDKNKDGKIQYAIIKGPNSNPNAESRTKWVTKTLKNYPEMNITSERIALENADWDRERAKHIVERWHNGGLLDQIEFLVCNNDNMALGAIDYLKEHDLKMPVVGVDGLQAALVEIEAGNMQGSIFQNGAKQSGTAFLIAKNLAEGKKADDGLQEFTFIENGHQVMIPFEKITKKNVGQYKK
ncbi:MAG: substrate-binding domain-containing protein [Cardiobacteriaceae bacterium]|nr:substrate-binding domain-containing protein [Cardiobacteriaceae bacterium]